MNPAAALAVTLLAAGAATPASARDLPSGLRARGSAIVASDGQSALAEGRSLLAAANPVQAIAAFRMALGADPRSLAALNGLGVAYDRLGRSDLARQHFETALSIDPAASDIAYNLGWTLLKAGQFRAAIAPLQSAAAGSDAQAAAAARRALAMIAARLETPSPVPELPALVQVAEARIDMVASGEAVLVLAASPRQGPALAAVSAKVAPALVADVRPAAASPVVVAQRLQPAATLPAPAMMAMLSRRLGDAAALTVPAVLPPEPVASPDQAVPQMIQLTDRPPEAPPEPPVPPATASAPTAPAQPDAPPPLAAIMAVLPGPKPPAPRAILAQVAWFGVRHESWAARFGEAAADWRKAAQPAAPATPADPRDRIRLAIARLERLVALVEAARA
jgi:Flp pilus assembly protein TadD